MLPVPATYASLFDGIKVYSDGSRTVILKALVKGDQVTITGTSGQYGVTAEGSFVNLHLMSVVVTVTPTPAETTVAPTDPTAATTKAPATTTKATTAATTKATTAATTATTAAPTVPIASLSASEVESIVWGQVEAARAGMTTNHNEILSTRSRSNANRLYVGHTGNNGDAESCGSIGKSRSSKWICQLYGNQEGFDTLEECVSALGNYLVTVHVPTMATDSTYTEFGVGVAKEESGGLITYYVFVACATPEDLQWQIDQGWYS